jgi:hypothetical protein
MSEEAQAQDAEGSAGPQVVGFVPEVQELVDDFLKAAKDADTCLREGNKSAGRRARSAFGDVKKKTTPLRKAILDRMKGKTQEEVAVLFKQYIDDLTKKKKAD